MRRYTVMADANCDLDPQLQKANEISVVPTHIILPDGSDIPSFHTWERFTRESFYAELKANPDGFSTSPPNIAEYESAFEQIAQKDEDILLVTISSAVSGSYGFAVQAREETLKKHPGMEIRIVDSMRFGPAIGMLALTAAEMHARGSSLAETAEYLEQNKNRLHQAGWLDDLSFVAKRGRITHAKAFFGTLAGVKPIGEFDYNGLTTVIGKAKGAKSAYSLLIKYIKRTITDAENQVIVVAHTNRLEQAEVYRDLLKAELRPKDVVIRDVFPMCGINVGPGLMAAYYMGTPISEGLVAERAIIEECSGQGK